MGKYQYELVELQDLQLAFKELYSLAKPTGKVEVGKKVYTTEAILELIKNLNEEIDEILQKYYTLN